MRPALPTAVGSPAFVAPTTWCPDPWERASAQVTLVLLERRAGRRIVVGLALTAAMTAAEYVGDDLRWHRYQRARSG